MMYVIIPLVCVAFASINVHGMEKAIECMTPNKQELEVRANDVTKKTITNLSFYFPKVDRTSELFYALNGHGNWETANPCEAVEKLFHSGVDVNVHNNNLASMFHGCTPLYKAISVKCERCVGLLVKKADFTILPSSESRCTYVGLALIYKNYKAVKILFDAGASVDSKNEMMNNTPLFFEVLKGCSDGVKVLLECGGKALITPEIMERAEDLSGSNKEQIVDLLKKYYL